MERGDQRSYASLNPPLNMCSLGAVLPSVGMAGGEPHGHGEHAALSDTETEMT